jgi:hypothetical protein
MSNEPQKEWAQEVLRRHSDRVKGPSGTRGIAQAELDLANALHALLRTLTPAESVGENEALASLVAEVRTWAGINLFTREEDELLEILDRHEKGEE